MKPISIAFVLCMVFCACQAQDPVTSSNDLLYKVVNECFHQDYSKCIKQNVLSFLNTQVPQEPSSRQVDLNEVDSNDSSAPSGESEEALDDKILARVRRYFLSHQFVIESPEYMKDTAIVYNPAKDPADFDVVYKNNEQGEQARQMSGRQEQDKTLMPLVMMLKMKMKMLMPMMMMMVGMKAAKAYVLSKLSILIVLGFVIMQMLSKKGMMPMNMMAMPMPMSAAGAESATPPSSYGSPAVTTSSYDPAANWEANSGGPYSRVWDAHNSAYSVYKPSYSTSYSTSGSSGVGVAATYQSSSY
uniref:Osiris 20 n=1 Tax=Cacopsylla melanoneura TaxID=428564 RepID=A0A8D9F1Q9_9HEMI